MTKEDLKAKAVELKRMIQNWDHTVSDPAARASARQRIDTWKHELSQIEASLRDEDFSKRQLGDIQTDKVTNQNGKLRKLNWKKLRKGGPVPEPFSSVAGQSSEELSKQVKSILDAATEDLEDGETNMVRKAVAYATAGMTDEEREEVFGRYPALAGFMSAGSDSDLDEPADSAQVNPSGGGMWPLGGGWVHGNGQRSTDNQNQSFNSRASKLLSRLLA